MIEKKMFRIISISIMLIYICSMCIFYFVGGEEIKTRINDTGEMVLPERITEELLPNKFISQPFTLDAQKIKEIQFQVATLGRKNTSNLIVRICREKNVLWEKKIPTNSMVDMGMNTIVLKPEVDIENNELLYLVLFSSDSYEGNAVSIPYGNKVDLIKSQVEINNERSAYWCGNRIDGMMRFSITGSNKLWIGDNFGLLSIIGFSILGLWLIWSYYCNKNSKKCILVTIVSVYLKYNFLFIQLIKRDFKRKYKRSILGVLWSFLNPLLSMIVQYLVFSTLFNTDITNYPVYLLSGIICFSFISEVTTLALTSIVSNSGLITKVYVPKYIYPVSQVLSSCVNFLISLIPLLLMILLTGTRITSAITLLPFGILCMFFLSIGIALFLSAAMVFFRDIQFLWGVFTMLWMYATPIFYPESIIPKDLIMIYRMNPMYHIIKFIRIILIEGVSPPPNTYFYCFLVGVIPLVLGSLFFRSKQDKFIFYL